MCFLSIYIPFMGIYVLFVGIYVLFMGIYVLLVGIYVLFVDIYVLLLSIYMLFMGIYVLLIGMYVLFVDIYVLLLSIYVLFMDIYVLLMCIYVLFVDIYVLPLSIYMLFIFIYVLYVYIPTDLWACTAQSAHDQAGGGVPGRSLAPCPVSAEGKPAPLPLSPSEAGCVCSWLYFCTPRPQQTLGAEMAGGDGPGFDGIGHAGCMVNKDPSRAGVACVPKKLGKKGSDRLSPHGHVPQP